MTPAPPDFSKGAASPWKSCRASIESALFEATLRHKHQAYASRSWSIRWYRRL
jgi:hypothetical protein